MRTCAIISACVLLLGVGVAARTGYADNVYYFDVTNNSGAERSDLHLDFTGTGGTATLVLVENSDSCGIPTVSNPGTPWDITWPDTCLDDKQRITIKIYSDNPVTFSSGYWTPGNVALSPADVVATTRVPALTDWGIAALVVAVLAAGALLLLRRRRAETA